MSEPEDKSRGLLGRLFGRKPAEPTVTPHPVPPAPAVTRQPPAPDDAPGPPSPAAMATPAAEPESEAEGAVPEADAAPKKQGWFARLKVGLSKTSSKLSEGIAGVFTKRKLDAGTLEELEDLLIGADLGVATTQRITDALAKDRFDKSISPDEVREVLAQLADDGTVEELLRDALRALAGGR